MILGKIPRATLYGVYDLLERLGCRWYYMDAADEIVPSLTREKVIRSAKDAGFVYVTLDLQGWRTGSMNEAIDTPPV